MAACSANFSGGNDCEDCVQVVKTTKKVRVPCHRNTYKQYTVKVPRQVTKQVPREVKWTDYETREKQVPYTDYKCEQRIKYQDQKYQVPTQHTITKMVNRSRQVKIPYTVSVPVNKFRTEKYQVPINKTKTVYDKRTKTVYDTQVRTRCEPKVTYVTKEIPVYNVVARPAAPCPPDQGAGGGMGASASASMGR